MYRPDQIERLKALGDEQYQIALKWEREQEERERHIEAMSTAHDQKDAVAYENAFQAYLNVGVENHDFCEHERSIWKPCAACDEIDQAINPEFYDGNGDRLDDEAIEAIVNANPERYGQ